MKTRGFVAVAMLGALAAGTAAVAASERGAVASGGAAQGTQPGMHGSGQAPGGMMAPGPMGPGHAAGGMEHGPSGSGTMQGPMGGMMQGRMGGMMMGAGPEGPMISRALAQREQLGLTEPQVKALESLRSEFERDSARRRADIDAAERELADLLRESPADLARAEAKIRQIAGLQADLRLARLTALEKGKAVLTPEQRKKLDSPPSAGAGQTSRGMEEMQRFMNSERAPQAMAAMMEMARRMGDGDLMLGMVRMMDTMGGHGAGTDAPKSGPSPAPERK